MADCSAESPPPISIADCQGITITEDGGDFDEALQWFAPASSTVDMSLSHTSEYAS